MTKKKTETKDVFLETSVILQSLLGHSEIKKNIRGVLEGARKWSSFYVLMECKRSILKTLIDIYYVALEEDSPADVMRFFSESFRQREVKTILRVLAHFCMEADISNDKEKFLNKLELFIQTATEYFDTFIDEYVANKTQCPLAKASIKEGYEQFKEEIECKIDCSVERLWHENKKLLKRIVQEENNPPHRDNKGFTKPLPIIKSAIDNPKAPKTKTNCKKCGDFIIALEMPKQLCLTTLDKAFQSIGAIINKEVTVLPSVSALRKEA